jgi:hypothetical protein
MDSEIVAAFIGPLFTTLLAGLGIALKSLQVRRRDQHSRLRDMEAASRTVTFIEAYLSAQDRLSPKADQAFIRERALRDLEAAYQTMIASAAAEHDVTSTRAWLTVIKRILLIPLRRTSAKIIRVLFYIALVFGFLFNAATISAAFSDPDLQRDIPLMIFVILFLSALYFLPLVPLYFWVRWLDRDRTPPAPTSPPTATWSQPGGFGTWQPVPGPPPGSGVPQR